MCQHSSLPSTALSPQGPPFRLSYRGLGEPLCFLAFGPLATSAFYLAQVPDYALTHLIPGALSKGERREDEVFF